MGRRKATDEQKQAALRLLEAGKTGDDVAAQYGVSRATVYLWKMQAKKASKSTSTEPANSDVIRRIERLETQVELLTKLLVKKR